MTCGSESGAHASRGEDTNGATALLPRPILIHCSRSCMVFARMPSLGSFERMLSRVGSSHARFGHDKRREAQPLDR
jgi:hypothetical protein